MNFNPKKVLLAGTALVAASAFIAPVHAADLTLSGAAVWGTAGNGMVATPTTADNVIMTTHALSFDSTEVGVVAAADITATTGNITVDTTGDAADVAFTLGSITASGASDITVDNLNASTNRNVALVVTNGVSTLGNLIVRNTEAGALTTVATTIGGALTVGGTTALTGGANASASTAALTVGGNATFTGAATVTGGAGGALADATLTLNGVTNAFTAGLTLDDSGANGDAHLVLSGAAAQTVSGVIDGGAAGEGFITISGAGATFSGAIGATNDIASIILSNDATGSAVTFQAAVGVDAAAGIVLGDGGGTADTYTATFDTTTAGFTVDGTVEGAATDTSAVVVSGGNTLVQANAWGGGTVLDTLAVTGTGTNLDSNAAIDATAITVGAGATLDQGAGLITGAIANSGTLHFTGTGGVTGDITGTGTLNVDANNTITGSIAATSIALAEAADLTVTAAAGARTLAANITMEDAAADGTDATLALVPGANGIDVTGNITTAINGEGEITIADGTGAVDFVGDIGTSALKVGALTVAGTSDNTVTTTGNYHVTTTTLDDADNFQFLGTTAQAVSGTFVAVGANDGVITVGNGTTTSDVTFTGVIGTGAGNDLGALTVSANAKATFDANATFDGLLTANNATIEVGHGDTLTTATQTDADITTWNVQVNQVGGGAQTVGQVAFSTDAVNLAVDTVHFDVQANSAPLTLGASVLDNVFAGNAAATIAGATVTDNSFIYGFTLVADTNNVDVTVAIDNSIENTVTNSGYAATGNQLITTLAASTNTQINQLQSTLAAASTQKAANDIIEAAASDVSGGAVTAGIQVAGATSTITNARLASLRSGETGMNAGEVVEGMNAWIQGFGQQSDQDARDGVSGYDADTYGIAVGIDTEKLADDVTVGLAFAYATTDVESDAISNATTDVDSYQLSLYGNLDLDEDTFVTGQVGYMWSENDTRRTAGGIAGLTANGSYDSDAVVVGAAVGRNYATGHGSLVVTPTVSANYMHYSADSYTETGANGANLTVDSDALNMFEVGLGVDAEWNIENANGSRIMPSLGLGVRHDLIGDEFEASNQFAGGGTAFKVKGADPASTTFDAGLGLKYQSTSNWTLSADYNFEYKSDYSSNAGMVKAAFQF